MRETSRRDHPPRKLSHRLILSKRLVQESAIRVRHPCVHAGAVGESRPMHSFCCESYRCACVLGSNASTDLQKIIINFEGLSRRTRDSDSLHYSNSKRHTQNISSIAYFYENKHHISVPFPHQARQTRNQEQISRSIQQEWLA